MTLIARCEDALVDEIIKADSLQPVEGARGAVMMEFENEDVSIEILPRLSDWGADLELSDNFTKEKHNKHFMYARNFLETRLGIMQFNIFDSHGAALNGYDFERQYVIDKYKDTPGESLNVSYNNNKIISRCLMRFRPSDSDE